MNKKGFAFVETIVTLTVLLVALTVLYTVFTNLLNQEKKSSEYDRPSDKYALYYIKQMWLANGGDKNYAEDITNSYKHYGVNKILLLKCDPSNHSINKSYSATVSNGFKKYISSIEKKCPDSSKYVFVAEFNNESMVKTNEEIQYNNQSYAHIFWPKLSN